MSKKITFKGQSIKSFSNWLKKFETINKSILLEIDETFQEFIAKTFNAEKSVVKFSILSFNEASFDVSNVSTNNSRIKIGIYDIKSLNKVLEQFSESEFLLTFNYAELNNKEGLPELTGSTIIVQNEILKIKVDCSSLKIFNYLPDDVFHNVVCDTQETGIEFELTKENIARIVSLSNLEKEFKHLVFSNEKDKEKLFVKGETFELELSISKDIESSLPILKEQFYSLDQDNYSVKIGEDRMILKSLEGNNITVISEADIS